jgi:hypothetical protein
VAARVSRGCMYGISVPLALHLIFIEHASGLPHHGPISTLIQLGSNHVGLNPNCYDCLLGTSPTLVSDADSGATQWAPPRDSRSKLCRL